MRILSGAYGGLVKEMSFLRFHENDETCFASLNSIQALPPSARFVLPGCSCVPAAALAWCAGLAPSLHRAVFLFIWRPARWHRTRDSLRDSFLFSSLCAAPPPG